MLREPRSRIKILNSFLIAGFLVASVGSAPFSSHEPSREVAGLKECGTGYAKLAGKLLLETAKLPVKGLNWVVDAPKRAGQKESAFAQNYKEIATKKVSDYFADPKNPTEAETQAFLKDFEFVYGSFAKVHLAKRSSTKAGAQFKEAWEIAGPELVKEPSFLAKHGAKSLETLFLERHFEATRTDAAKRDAQIRDLKFYAFRVVGAPYFLTAKVGSMILGESKWTGRLILASILGAAFANIHEPITANLTTMVNQHLGWVGVSLQMGITRLTANLEKAREVHSDMQKAEEELQSVNQKYKIRELSKNEAVKLWEKLDETFLNYSKEMRSVIPDNIASGRAYYKDGNFTNPVAFITAAASLNMEKMLHEDVVRTLELKRDLTKEPLSDAEQKDLDFHQAQIAVSKKRLGTVLAMWRVYEIIYPELTRAAFMKAGVDGDRIRTSYEVYRQGLDFDAYAEEYTEQMHAALIALGVEINQIEEGRLASTVDSSPRLPVDLNINPGEPVRLRN